MDQRFGPFSECAKQHVAVKPQKGELLSKNTSVIKPSMFQHSHYLCAGLAAEAMSYAQCLIFVVTRAVITYAGAYIIKFLSDFEPQFLLCLQLCLLRLTL